MILLAACTNVWLIILWDNIRFSFNTVTFLPLIVPCTVFVLICAKKKSVLFSSSVFISNYHVLQIHLLQIHVLQIHLLQIHVLQIHLLQIHSMFYKSTPLHSTPCFTINLLGGQQQFFIIVFFSIRYQTLISDIDTFLLALFIVSLDLKSKVIKVLFMKAVVL